MTRTRLVIGLMLLPLPVLAQQPTAAPAPIVFFDIASPDDTRLRAFYRELFAWKIGADGTFTAPVTPPLSGLIRRDPADAVFYVGVEDVNATLKKAVANGGTVQIPRLEVPGRVIVGVFRDPAGNPVGLVEMKDGKAKIP
jgi:uncharacterized protein